MRVRVEAIKAHESVRPKTVILTFTATADPGDELDELFNAIIDTKEPAELGAITVSPEERAVEVEIIF